MQRGAARESGAEVPLTVEEDSTKHALIVKGNFADVMTYLQKAELMHPDTVDEIKIQLFLNQLERVLQNLSVNKIPALKFEIDKRLEQAEKKFVNPPTQSSC